MKLSTIILFLIKDLCITKASTFRVREKQEERGTPGVNQHSASLHYKNNFARASQLYFLFSALIFLINSS